MSVRLMTDEIGYRLDMFNSQLAWLFGKDINPAAFNYMEKTGKENKELYLSEDKDILDELNKIGPKSNNFALAEQQQKISVIQVKSILRSRKTTVDLDKSNRRFTLVIIFFAIVQVMLATFQFSFDLLNSDKLILQIFFGVLFFVVFISMTRYMDRIMDEEK